MAMRVVVLYSYCLNVKWRSVSNSKDFLEKTWSCFYLVLNFGELAAYSKYWNIREDRVIHRSLCGFERA